MNWKQPAGFSRTVLTGRSPSGGGTEVGESNMADFVTLQVNGEARQCNPETRLPQLLEQLGLNPRLVAVEYNGEILHRQFWAETQIQPNDRLEIVTIVGGG